MSLKNLMLSGALLTCFAYTPLRANVDDMWVADCGDYYCLPRDCSDSPSSGRFYVGGGATYVDTHLPQNQLVDEGLFDIQYDLYNGGGSSGKKDLTGLEPAQSITSRSPCRWVVYAGYEVDWNPCWSFGLEFGYKNLGEFKTVFGPYTSTVLLKALANFEVAARIKPTVPSNLGPQNASRRTSSESWDGLITARFNHSSGMNFFVKGGAAWIRMKLVEQNLPLFIPQIYVQNQPSFNPTLVETPELKEIYYNIYPELVLGVGYHVMENVNLALSWSHIFGPTSTSRYSQNVSSSSAQFFQNFPGVGTLYTRRVAQAPGFDIVMLTLEFSFGGR